MTAFRDSFPNVLAKDGDVEGIRRLFGRLAVVGARTALWRLITTLTLSLYSEDIFIVRLKRSLTGMYLGSLQVSAGLLGNQTKQCKIRDLSCLTTETNLSSEVT